MLDHTQVHELRVSGGVVPLRPTLAEANNDPDVLLQLLHGWADACDMGLRESPPEYKEQVLQAANNHMRWVDAYRNEMDSFARNEITFEELMRRLRDSGG